MSRTPYTEAAAAARRVAVLREQTPEHRRPPVDAAEWHKLLERLGGCERVGDRESAFALIAKWEASEAKRVGAVATWTG